MTTFVLVFIFASINAPSASAAMLSVPGFDSEQECIVAASRIALTMEKRGQLNFFCLPQTRKS